MRIGVMGIGLLGTLTASTAAWAQTPPARTGFQMDIRTGYAIPYGTAIGSQGESDGGELAMSDYVSGQVPLIVDIGGKVIPNLFVGGYFGFGFGGAAGNASTSCERSGGGCLAVSLRVGALAQVHFIPEGDVNPWLGYGIGFESVALAQDRNGTTSSLAFGGWEFAHFMGGVDFRLTRVFGIGPFIDVSMGQYGSASADNGDTTIDQDIEEKALHGWVTFGARFVFFP